MTDKLLIEALEELAEFKSIGIPERIELAKRALAAHRSQQEAAQEPRLCGFCGKSQHQVKKLLATPCAAICDECNQIAGRVLGTSPAPSESEAKDGPTEQDLARHRAQLKLDDLIRSGAVLSNVAFNLRQRVGAVLSGQQCGFLHEAQKDWDEALREYRAALSASGQKGENQ